MNSIYFSVYHSVLKITTSVVALSLLFVSGLISQTTALVAKDAGSYLANAIGMSVSIPPNELNQITAALTEKERQLTARELTLREREIELGLSTGATNTGVDKSTFILSVILFILLLMIVFNYILDYSRQREVGSTEQRWA